MTWQANGNSIFHQIPASVLWNLNCPQCHWWSCLCCCVFLPNPFTQRYMGETRRRANCGFNWGSVWGARPRETNEVNTESYFILVKGRGENVYKYRGVVFLFFLFFLAIILSTCIVVSMLAVGEHVEVDLLTKSETGDLVKLFYIRNQFACAVCKLMFSVQNTVYGWWILYVLCVLVHITWVPQHRPCVSAQHVLYVHNMNFEKEHANRFLCVILDVKKWFCIKV